MSDETTETTEISETIRQFSNGKPRMQYDDWEVICPYCGGRFGDCWEWVKDMPNQMNCDDCGGKFEYWAEHSVMYYTKPIKGNLSGSEKNPG